MQVTIVGLLLAGTAMLAQQPARLEFEVASVKPAAPPSGGRGAFIGSRGGPGTDDPGRISYTGFPLQALITAAYQIKAYQLSGPAFMNDFESRFDIVAKIPAGATKDDVRVMLQNLLVDRFKMTLHHETKELPLYELTVGKNGPKMKASVEDPNAPKPGEGPLPPIGKDGFPQLPPGRKNRMMFFGPGGARIMATVSTPSEFAEMLGNQLGSPVVDKTGLTGTYDFTIDFAPERGLGGLSLPPPPPPGGGDLGGPRAATDPSDVPNLFTAVQEQLGLKLEKKKGPVDTIVIDHLEKTPTEN